MTIGFYALGALDILGLVESKTTEADRENWRAWMWAQQSSLSVWFITRVVLPLTDSDIMRIRMHAEGPFGTGFKGSPYMTPDLDGVDPVRLYACTLEFVTRAE